jgi:hypothetical protein
MGVLIQLKRLAPRVACLVSPPRNSETSTQPAEAKNASLSESPVSAFLGSRLHISISVLPMKSKNDFTVRTSSACRGWTRRLRFLSLRH